MKSGMKRIGGESYTPGTIKAWNSFAKLIREFCGDFKSKHFRELQWEDFNKDGFPQSQKLTEKVWVVSEVSISSTFLLLLDNIFLI